MTIRKLPAGTPPPANPAPLVRRQAGSGARPPAKQPEPTDSKAALETTSRLYHNRMLATDRPGTPFQAPLLGLGLLDIDKT